MVEARQEPAVISKLLGPSEEASPSRSRMNPVSYFLYSDASGLADPAGTEPPHSQAGQFVEMVQEAPRIIFLWQTRQSRAHLTSMSFIGGGGGGLTFRLLSTCPNHPRARNQTTRGSP